MANVDTQQPSRTYRGTWDEILAHSSEISKTSKVELRVYEPRPYTATMALMQQWLALGMGLPPSDYIIATVNVGHLARFVRADPWTNIVP